MIKIIKHGQKEFIHTCSRCGCEFTYEFEDIRFTSTLTSTFNKTVTCPDCGECCYIDNKQSQPIPPQIGWPTPGEPIPCNMPSDTALNPCSSCDWWKKMQQPGFSYAGDTPCTWCSKGPYKVTCASPISYTTTSYVKAELQQERSTTDYKDFCNLPVGEFSSNFDSALDVNVADYTCEQLQDTSEVAVIATTSENIDDDFVNTDIVPLESLQEPDLSAKDVVTYNVSQRTDSFINSTIPSIKKKRNYKKKCTK